jgi:hypothetical protein
MDIDTNNCGGDAVKFKVYYPSDLKDTMIECFKLVQKDIDKRHKGSLRMKFKRFAMRKMKDPISDLNPTCIFEAGETEGTLEINTGLDFLVDKNRIYKELKVYEDLSEGQVKIVMIDETLDATVKGAKDSV